MRIPSLQIIYARIERGKYLPRFSKVSGDPRTLFQKGSWWGMGQSPIYNQYFSLVAICWSALAKKASKVMFSEEPSR
jgi:hypothetical protein